VRVCLASSPRGGEEKRFFVQARRCIHPYVYVHVCLRVCLSCLPACLLVIWVCVCVRVGVGVCACVCEAKEALLLMAPSPASRWRSFPPEKHGCEKLAGWLGGWVSFLSVGVCLHEGAGGCVHILLSSVAG